MYHKRFFTLFLTALIVSLLSSQGSSVPFIAEQTAHQALAAEIDSVSHLENELSLDFNSDGAFSRKPEQRLYDEQIEITPSEPTTSDVIEGTVSGTSVNTCVPEYSSHEIIDQLIRIDATKHIGLCGQAITPWEFSVEVGSLRSGTYTVEFYVNDSSDPWVSSAFTVMPSEPIQLNASASTKSIQVDWNLIAPLSGNLDHYDLYRNANGAEFALIHTLSGSQYTDDDSALTADVEYCYQVKAVDRSDAVVGPSNVGCTKLGKLTIWMPHQVIPSNATNIPVPINIVNGNDLCIHSFELLIRYDTTIVHPNSSMLRTTYTPNFVFDVFTISPDLLIVSGNNSRCVRLYGPDSFFHVFFDAQGSEGQVSSLDIVGAVWDDEGDFNPISNMVTEDGSLSLANNGFRGDVNLDGDVNLADAHLALEIANLSMTPTAQQEVACDLNGDRACNAADSSLIICHIATQNSNECAHELNLPKEPVEVKIGSVNHTQARPKMATMQIEINNAPDFAGGQFSLAYNPQEITPTAVLSTSLTNGFELHTNRSQAGLLQISLAADTPIRADGTIIELALTVNESISNLNFASVRLHDASGRDFETSALQRKIELVPYSAIEHKLYLPVMIH